MLKHSFTESTKDFYLYNGIESCGLCPRAGSELHHIKGRLHKENSSILNSFLLCRRCHNQTGIHSPELQSELLNKTLDLLLRYNYKLKEIDYKFIKLYEQDYSREILNRLATI